MMFRILGFVIIANCLCLIPAGCSSGGSISPGIDVEEMPEDFLARTRFEKPTPRPLGRVQLRWELVEGADGYEIQMSELENFQSIKKSWTIRGNNLELPIQSGEILWFRIRSFNKTSKSSWSVVVKIDEGAL